MTALVGGRVIVGVTGGIAAYKACELVRSLVTAGAEVQVVMTRRATEFVGPLTFETLSGRPVKTSEFERRHEEASMGTEHIRLARFAQALVVAPASAATIARFAGGLADDLLSTLYLAFDGPVIVAPAMNTVMLEHPATRENLARLEARGHTLIAPREGTLACGEIGAGAMAEIDLILGAVSAALAGLAARAGGAQAPDLAPASGLGGRRVLVTAGPTREPIDPVRFITNASSGRMGVAIAKEAARRGAHVVLVHGPLAVEVPAGVESVPAPTVGAMLDAVLTRVPRTDVLIASAAPADFVAVEVRASKIKKDSVPDRLMIELRRAPDILEAVTHREATGRPRLVVGFAAESEDLVANARRKLEAKRLDLIVANELDAFCAPAARVVLIAPLTAPEEFTGDKGAIARRLIDWVQDRLEHATGPRDGG